ncbi:MAG: hypothetical protein HGB22_11300 [Chlorobiaceae bacterium]|nr:hypothetical protein [Chlorobiaceae bacterium]
MARQSNRATAAQSKALSISQADYASQYKIVIKETQAFTPCGFASAQRMSEEQHFFF